MSTVTVQNTPADLVEDDFAAGAGKETAAEEVTYVQALHAYVSVNTDQCVYILIRNDVESPD